MDMIRNESIDVMHSLLSVWSLDLPSDKMGASIEHKGRYFQRCVYGFSGLACLSISFLSSLEEDGL